MKKNNAGFMLVEALVMSMVILGVLIFMFIQFENISRGYDRSFHYNTIQNIYIVNEIKQYLIENSDWNSLKEEVDNNTKKYINITDKYTDNTFTTLKQQAKVQTILLADESLSQLKGYRTKELSEKMNDFVNYVKVDKVDTQYRLLVEFSDETFASLRMEA